MEGLFAKPPRRRLGHGVFRSAGEFRQAESVRCLVGAVLEKGIIVDATIISAPSSTKNRSNARDPEMHRTRKGNRRHFGMKLHIGTAPPWRGRSPASRPDAFGSASAR